MPIQLDPSIFEPSPQPPALGAGTVAASPPQRLLILLNPGRVSRYYLEGLVRAAAGLGLEYRTLEMGALWQRKKTDIAGLTRDLAAVIRGERIGAVLGYVLNGVFDAQCVRGPDGAPRSLFDALGVPHLMLWTDHPQWASEKLGLDPELQAVLRSPNNHHFVKSEAAALEIKRVLGWTHCYGLPVAEDPEMVRPVRGVEAEFDVVTILGSPPRLDDRLVTYLDATEPDVNGVMGTVAEIVVERLETLWKRDAPPTMVDELRRLGVAWAEMRRQDVKTAAVRHLPALSVEFPEALDWLVNHPTTYFDAVEHLWLFGGWQRTFYLRYLAGHFRVAVFGADWRGVGLGGGGGAWVDYRDQAGVYARGRVALNISQGSEEEGVSHKPFQMAASGVPMVHIDRAGLSECFQVGREIEVFDTPREAREVIASLICDPERRASLAAAARRRLEREHTWERRMQRMLTLAGPGVESFRVSPQSAPAV